MAPNELIYLDKERMARRGDKPMAGAEKLAEAEWLLDGGVHPDHIAQQLGTTLHALDKLARDRGRKDLARRLNAQQIRHDRAAGQGERRWAA